PVPLVVGSDGTVYHFHASGEIQAWDPNGDRSAPPTGTAYAGKLLWTFTAATPWSNQQLPGYRPALFKATGHDVIYFCNPVANTPAMAEVNAAGFGAYQGTTAPCSNAPIVVDPQGYAFVATGTSLRMVSPGGAVVAQLPLTGSVNDGTNLTLGDDDILYLIA